MVVPIELPIMYPLELCPLIFLKELQLNLELLIHYLQPVSKSLNLIQPVHWCFQVHREYFLHYPISIYWRSLAKYFKQLIK